MIMLYIARTLDGVTGGNITTAQAYVSDITPEEERAQGLGLLQASFGVGFIFGPAFGGLLSNFGPVAPFVGATVITTGTLLLTVFTLKESLPTEDRTTDDESGWESSIPLRDLLARRGLVVVLLIGFFGSLAFSALPAIFALYADRVLFRELPDPEQIQLYIGLMLTFNGMMQVVTQLALLRPLIRRLGERWVLVVGESALLAAFLGITWVTNAILVTLLLAPFAFGRGVSEPSLQSLVTKFGSERHRGQLLGTYQSARSMALIVGPVWAGFAFENISPQAVFLVGGWLILIALVAAIFLLRIEKPQTQPAGERPSPIA
jgi:predicted MFS family arabinose efflux permease